MEITEETKDLLIDIETQFKLLPDPRERYRGKVMLWNPNNFPFLGMAFVDEENT
jgi:hypothetical protein